MLKKLLAGIIISASLIGVIATFQTHTHDEATNDSFPRAYSISKTIDM